MFSHHHNVLTIPGGADLPIEFHSQLAKKWWKNGNLAGPKELNTFVNPVENTVPEWVKRRDAEINDSDKGETSTQPPSEEVSTYKCAFSTLRESEDFNAFFSTAVPHARSEESFLRLRTIFLINTSGSTLQLSQKIQADRQVLRRASELLILALTLVVVEVLERANLEVFVAMAGKRVHGGERLPEGDPEWLKKKLSEFRIFIAQSKGSIVENMIEKGPGILKAKSILNRQGLNGRRLKLWSIEAKAELDEEASYKLKWHFAGVEVLDDETLNRVLIENREKVQMAHAEGKGTHATRFSRYGFHFIILW